MDKVKENENKEVQENKNDPDMKAIHEEALKRYDQIITNEGYQRQLSLEDRRFNNEDGAQWEGQLGEQFEEKPQMVISKIKNSTRRIENEFRANQKTVKFRPRDGQSNMNSQFCQSLHRSDEHDSWAREAYLNAFSEMKDGGFGAWYLYHDYEDDEDAENLHQRIMIEPIYEADSCVFFDPNAKLQDKSDAEYAYILKAMSKEAYEDIFDDDVSSWDRTVNECFFDWESDESVYVAEYYVKEREVKKVSYYKYPGDKKVFHYTEEQKEENPEKFEMDIAKGAEIVSERDITFVKVRKYILSGGSVLEDCGHIAGSNIPIVPIYNDRTYLDGVEKFCGHVRPAKDAQRLKNMSCSKIAEIAGYSAREKPIFTPEQIDGHEDIWATENIEEHAFMTLNAVEGPDGQMVLQGPIGYTKPPSVPPALATIMTMSEQDLKDIVGDAKAGEELRSNISGDAVGLIQQRQDLNTSNYQDNFAIGLIYSGKVWLGMASEIYVEEGRTVKLTSATGEIESAVLMQKSFNDKGESYLKNDVNASKFECYVDVGPSSSTKKEAALRGIREMMQFETDPEEKKILSAAAFLNMEGEGLSELQEYKRKQLVAKGVFEPTEEDKERIAKAANAKQEPTAEEKYLETESAKNLASIEKTKADIAKVLSDAKLNQAKYLETLSDTDRKDLEQILSLIGGNPQNPPQLPQTPI